MSKISEIRFLKILVCRNRILKIPPRKSIDYKKCLNSKIIINEVILQKNSRTH